MYGDPTPLHSNEAVVAMWELWGDVDAVLNALSFINTWGELRHLDHATRIQLLGHTQAVIPLPDTCPPLRPLPDNAQAISPFATGKYPPHLDGRKWPVLYTRGDLPQTASVLISGRTHSSPQSTEIARSAALTASANRIPLIVPFVGDVALTAIRTAVAAGGKVCAVIPHSLEEISFHGGLLNDVVANGGSVLSVTFPGQHIAGEELAASVATDLCAVAVLTDVGNPGTFTGTLAGHLIAANRPLIMPAHNSTSTADIATGTLVLTQPSAFEPSWYGTSPRITNNVQRTGYAADVLVSTQAELAHAITQTIN